jgi:hypothetical protein
MFGFKEPSLETLALGSLVWTAFVLIAIFLFKEFIRDIQFIGYFQGHDDCMKELKNGPLKDVYQQWVDNLHTH